MLGNYTTIAKWKANMSQKSIELLQLLTQADADSVPGHEAEVREIFRADVQEESNGTRFTENFVL